MYIISELLCQLTLSLMSGGGGGVAPDVNTEYIILNIQYSTEPSRHGLASEQTGVTASADDIPDVTRGGTKWSE